MNKKEGSFGRGFKSAILAVLVVLLVCMLITGSVSGKSTPSASITHDGKIVEYSDGFLINGIDTAVLAVDSYETIDLLKDCKKNSIFLLPGASCFLIDVGSYDINGRTNSFTADPSDYFSNLYHAENIIVDGTATTKYAVYTPSLHNLGETYKGAGGSFAAYYDGSFYTSWDAFAAAIGGRYADGTVTLGRSLDLGSDTIYLNGDVTLDLAGYDISCREQDAGSSIGALTILKGSSVIITDSSDLPGSITGYKNGIYLRSSDLTVENIRVQAAGSNLFFVTAINAYAPRSSESCSLTVKNARVSVSNDGDSGLGKFGNANGIRAVFTTVNIETTDIAVRTTNDYSLLSSGFLLIGSDLTFTSGSVLLASTGTIHTILAVDESTSLSDVSLAEINSIRVSCPSNELLSRITITGGVFSENPSAYVPSSYTVMPQSVNLDNIPIICYKAAVGTSELTVREADLVAAFSGAAAKTGTAYYTMLEPAASIAEDGGMVTLLADNAEDVYLDSKNLTFICGIYTYDASHLTYSTGYHLVTSGTPGCDLTYLVTNQYDVTFDANGGTPALTTIIETYDTEYILPEEDPAYTGYTFDGWFTTGGIQIDNTTIVNLNENQTLSAGWTAVSCTLTLNNQGAATAGTQSVTSVYDSELPTLTVLPVKTGYSFNGYWSELGGTGTKYYTDTGIGTQTSHILMNMTLYAAWIPDNYSVTFDGNGGTPASTVLGQVQGTAYVLPVVPVLTGNTFSGWYTAVTGGSAVDASTIVLADAANQRLYAHWTAAGLKPDTPVITGARIIQLDAANGTAVTNFKATAAGASRYLWNINGAALTTSEDGISYTFSSTGSYTISVTAFNGYGSSGTSEMQVTVNQAHPIDPADTTHVHNAVINQSTTDVIFNTSGANRTVTVYDNTSKQTGTGTTLLSDIAFDMTDVAITSDITTISITDSTEDFGIPCDSVSKVFSITLTSSSGVRVTEVSDEIRFTIQGEKNLTASTIRIYTNHYDAASGTDMLIQCPVYAYDPVTGFVTFGCRYFSPFAFGGSSFSSGTPVTAGHSSGISSQSVESTILCVTFYNEENTIISREYISGTGYVTPPGDSETTIWYTASGSVWNFETMVNTDMSLYAAEQHAAGAEPTAAAVGTDVVPTSSTNTAAVPTKTPVPMGGVLLGFGFAAAALLRRRT